MPAENTTVGTAKALAEMELWELQPVLALLNTQNTFSFTRCKAKGSNVFQCLGHKCHRKTHHSVALEATVLFTASLGRTFTLKTKCWIEQNWTHFWLLLLCARTWNCLHKDNKNWMCKTLFSLAWICGIRLKHVKCCWNPREFDTLVIPKFRQWVWMFGKQISQNVNIRDSSFLCLWPWSVLFTGICHHELVDVYWLIIIIYLSWSWAHCWPVRFHETCQ